MKKLIQRSSNLFVALAVCVVPLFAQADPNYSFAAQQKFIPKELGRVYLGMPLKEFAKQVDLSLGDIEDDRFDEIRLAVPFEKGNIRRLQIEVGGFPHDGRDINLAPARSKRKNDVGDEFEINVKRLIIDKIPEKAFVYSITVWYEPEYKLYDHVVKTYGKDGDERNPADEYHFYDTQWVKRTDDGLLWLIRAFHKGEDPSLQLIGRIKGTPWSVDDLD